MSVFFACANANQALILETCGVPIYACREKAYIPMPCCQDAKLFNIGHSQFTFNTKDFWTTDDKEIYIVASASYAIDSTSRGTIMKAYKSFHQPKQKFLARIQNSFKSPFRSSEPMKTDVEIGVNEIISQLIVNNMRRMSINEISSIGLLFIDSIFEEAKCNLKDKNVHLTSVKILEIVQYNGRVVTEDVDDNNSDSHHQVKIEEEEIEDSRLTFNEHEIDLDVLESVDNYDNRDYIISVIHEEEPSMKLTTTEIIMKQTSVIHLSLSSNADDLDTQDPVSDVNVDIDA